MFAERSSQAIRQGHGIPNIPWVDYMKNDLKSKAFQHSVQAFALQPSTKTLDTFAPEHHEALRAENAFLLGEEGIPPFRVAHYAEMLKDAEFDEWLAELVPYINEKCLASIVGNCFYPGALHAALRHSSLRSLLGEPVELAWKATPF